MTAMPRIGLWYDLRNPEPSRLTFTELYGAVLEQIAWAESLGIGSAWFSEHHFAADGYVPSPLVFAAAAAQRTTTIRLGTNLMLAPLHDPIRLAEDAAAVSLLSGGRFDLGVGLGYRHVEYAAFGKSLGHRPSLLTEGIDIIRQAWSGREINAVGRRYDVSGVKVRPVPEQPPRILIGGIAEPAIRRAAALGDGFLSMADSTIPAYLDAARSLGRAPQVFAAQWAIVADDPEREWARVGDHALYQMNTYIDWGNEGPASPTPRIEDRHALLAGGAYEAWDPSTAATRILDLIRTYPDIQDIHFWAQLPGETPDSAAARIEVLARKVVPAVAAALQADPADQ
ncbi:alkanesulfonate monooxygenase SsuD/methylene tetrahydromethanopterin reductase-like flavin-dependent oxidoreductase (luciferase family) [Actinocorallia herbida]|uniref:Alkanesulfonate monooxygenase SsuD/methylene tetrahydromethanopterin reductase-like flavin-dependent oxidoreductase (Luciferase family) n=1 Tax=Actinocorallia herbida TaxID=58109 RepID=A0A3N1D1K5_9ACTN|nr:LLM class flavin-dependent oxidoreductase [Actinocorallia herbida]ROO87396.1 alkanesulfonate monooxygenase SsuD/methylene tetrahydromethanopterin reductase-like flavin-dependent oxidoreductase (luciferase family) [Actinocorallia herbida]